VDCRFGGDDLRWRRLAGTVARPRVVLFRSRTHRMVDAP
jgi:hypothetical protein